jgi:hypothetical protein
MRTALKNVRFPPNSDRKSRHLPKVCFTPESGHVRCTSPCLLWATSRHFLQSSRAWLTRIGTDGRLPLRSLFMPPQEVGCYLEPIVSEMRWLQTSLS